MQDTPSHITHVNPATGEVNYQVCAGTEEHIDAAVKTAHAAASKVQWRAMLPHKRAEILHKIADLMMAHIPCQLLDGARTNDRHGKSGAAMVDVFLPVRRSDLAAEHVNRC